MNSAFNFSEFSKQSPKGIFVIYFAQIYKTIKVTWVLLFLVVKDFSKIQALGIGYFYAALFAILGLIFLRAYLIYKNFQFKIVNNHFILKKGILKKSNIEIPFHRIQNINFKQNIVQQIIGVFQVSIETAGSKDTEIAIKALSLDKAKALKELISQNSNQKVDVDEIIKEKPLEKISFIELFKVSLTENHLQNLFLFFAILIGFFQQIQQVTDSLGQTEIVDGFIEENTNAISASILLVTVSLIILVVIALLSSFVKVFLIHFNLIAHLKEDAFEINQGLFTKKSIVLKKQKIQNITISTNPLKRLIGISFITFKQAVSGTVNTKKKDKLIRIVGCKKDQVEVIKDTLFNFAEAENNAKNFPDRYYKRRLFLFSFLFVISVYAVLYTIFNHAEILYSAIFVLPITLLLVLKKIKKRFYKFSDAMLIVGKGLLETHVTYLEFFKVQNIKMKQTFFQKKNNVADIILQTASGKIIIPCLNDKEALKMYNHTLYKVETSQAPWM